MTLMKIILILYGTLLILGSNLTVHGQKFRVTPVKNVGETITCHVGSAKFVLHPNKTLIAGINAAPNDEETQDIFDRISDYTELRSNIYTVPVLDDDINLRICPGDINYIAYNGKWLEAIYNETNNVWALYALIAHEVGHYVKAHDRTSLGSDHEIELEADEYAGEILAKMGACLSDAEAAFRSKIMGKNQTSHTHPPTDRRLIAVKRGWGKSGKACTTEPVISPSNPLPQTSTSGTSLNIDVNGQLNTIIILPASSSATIGAFMINYQNTRHTFYLKPGTSAEVFLNGQNNKVYVSKEIANFVRCIHRGQLNEVILQ